MKTRTSDLHIRAARALISPAVLHDELPLDDPGAGLIHNSRRNIGRVISGRDPRLLVIVGPCSIHDPDAALDYASRLATLARRVAADAMEAAHHPHCFPSLTRDGAPAVLTTSGNPATHLVLRGGSPGGPNFSAAAVGNATAILARAGLCRRVMVDCSHANSGKDPARQPIIATELAGRIAAGDRSILGLMLESHLVAGRQDRTPGTPLTYGQSITDACLGWDDTSRLLTRLARTVRNHPPRRTARPER